MKNVSVTIRESFSNGMDSATFTFTTRIQSAIQMLEIEDRMHTEQETGGVWDDLHSGIREAVESLDVRFSLQPEYFRGYKDVIFELAVTVEMPRSLSLDLQDERVSGTVLSAVCNHFGWTGWSTPVVNDTYNPERFIHLSAFERQTY